MTELGTAPAPCTVDMSPPPPSLPAYIFFSKPHILCDILGENFMLRDDKWLGQMQRKPEIVY